MSNNTQTGEALAPAKSNAKPQLNLSLDLVTAAIGDKSLKRYQVQREGDTYKPKSGKNAGKVMRRTTSRVSLRKVSDIVHDEKCDIEKATVIRQRDGLSMLKAAKHITDEAVEDGRIIAESISSRVTAQGMAKIGIVLSQTSHQRMYAWLLARGVPMSEARKLADKYDSK